MADRAHLNPFLTWLLGVIMIAMGVYIGTRFPGPTSQRVLAGAAGMFISGGLASLAAVPSRMMGMSRLEGRVLGVVTVLGAATAHALRPEWLASGVLTADYLGWSSPGFPAFLMLVALASLARMLGVW